MKSIVPAFIVLIIVIVGSGILYRGGLKDLKKNQGPLPPLETSSPSQAPATFPPVNQGLINEQLDAYLPQKILKPEFGGKVFCTHHLYGYEEDKQKSTIWAYIWAYCEEYYQDKGDLKTGAGVSLPIRVTLELQKGVLAVHSHEEPKNGDQYTSSIKQMFPEKFANEAIKGYPVDEFPDPPKTQAEKYYAQ